MDEPFGSLDSQSRNAMQEFLLQVWQETGKTIIFISHNIDETVFLSQKVIGFSQRPGTIKLDLPIDLPYPRERTGQDFNRYRKTILDYLSRERRRLYLEATDVVLPKMGNKYIIDPDQQGILPLPNCSMEVRHRERGSSVCNTVDSLYSLQEHCLHR